tara:strand:- start:277 stop:462 length:186 start_codon:yes stop_codon:yes gene_type:complete
LQVRQALQFIERDRLRRLCGESKERGVKKIFMLASKIILSFLKVFSFFLSFFETSFFRDDF